MTGTSPEGRRRRLAEELGELGLTFADDAAAALLLDELEYARHPRVHERRVASYGCFVEPTVSSDRWPVDTALSVLERPVGRFPIEVARRFADGLSSWISRRVDGNDSSVVFDRPAGSERDLVVLAAATGATVVQRHPRGVVRLVGAFGVARHDGLDWHLEPPLDGWIAGVSGGGPTGVAWRMLEFAVHDLGSRGIGALLVLRADAEPVPEREAFLADPPPLRIDRPEDLAPLTHVLSQLDGAAVFDSSGTLRQLGARLVPSPEAEASVDGLRGMRHTAGRRHSYDDPAATVIVVSEDGPVTVFRAGELIGRTDTDAELD